MAGVQNNEELSRGDSESDVGLLWSVRVNRPGRYFACGEAAMKIRRLTDERVARDPSRLRTDHHAVDLNAV